METASFMENGLFALYSTNAALLIFKMFMVAFSTGIVRMTKKVSSINEKDFYPKMGVT
jgi:hypothetical protein